MAFWNAYWTFTAFVFGAIVGSFLNVCIYRLPAGLSLSSPPSHCPSCKHRLKFIPDMIPLFNQLWYWSRCRYCKTPFSWRYFWVEVLTACLFAAAYIRYGILAPDNFWDLERTVSPFLGCAFVGALIAIFFIDLEHYQIPDVAVLVAFVAAVLKDGFFIWRGFMPLWQEIPGLSFKVPVPQSILFGLLAFWLLWQFAALATAALGKEAMGAGDSLLMAAMGAFLLPWPLLIVAFLAAVALGTVGGLAGIFFAARSEKAVGTASVANAEPDDQTDSTPSPEEIPPVMVTAEMLAEARRTGEFSESSSDADGSAQPQLDGFKVLAAQAFLHKMRAVDLRRTPPMVGMEAHFAPELARRLGVVPVCEAERGESTELVVAVPRPEMNGGLAELQEATPLPIRTVLADPLQIEAAQRRIYGSAATPELSSPEADTRDQPFTEDDVPPLPAGSRWGRLVTVVGTWVAVGALWLGAAAGSTNLGMGIGVGVVGLAAAAAMITWGSKVWTRSDEAWLPAMDTLFEEGEPGPRFIPFGPYLVAGTLSAMFVGKPIVHWYLQSVMMLPPDTLGKLFWE